MLIVENISVQLTEWSNTLLLHFLYNLPELVEKFQSALYRHYESGVYLYKDSKICRHFVRLMHHISFTSSSVQ